LGQLYHDYGYADHKDLALDALRAIAPDAFAPLATNAPACVEVFLHRLPDGRRLIQLINLSGFNGTTMERCIPIHGVHVTLPEHLVQVLPLDGAPAPQLSWREGRTTLRFVPLTRYQAFIAE